jgi:hypothetical protein
MGGILRIESSVRFTLLRLSIRRITSCRLIRIKVPASRLYPPAAFKSPSVETRSFAKKRTYFINQTPHSDESSPCGGLQFC